jgi:hypothetical protein
MQLQMGHSEGSVVENVTCVDCLFWCGRCIEPANKGRKSLTHVASDPACKKFFDAKRSS